MNLVILDPADESRIIARRREMDQDRFDEVWEGVYLMSPLANNEHQQIVSAFDRALGTIIVTPSLGIVQPGANVSDLAGDWEHNYRCPDVVVYLNSTTAIDHNTHWQGDPTSPSRLSAATIGRGKSWTFMPRSTPANS